MFPKPAVPETDGTWKIDAGQAGQRHDGRFPLGCRFQSSVGLFQKPGRRSGGHIELHRGRGSVRWQAHGNLPGFRDEIGPDQQPEAVVQLLRRNLAGLQHRFNHRQTAFGQRPRRFPEEFYLGRRGRILSPPPFLKRIPGYFGIRPDESGKLLPEKIPLALFAQHEKPIPPKLFGQDGAFVSYQKVSDFIGGGIFQADLQPPEFDIGFEHMAVDPIHAAGQPEPVAGDIGIMGGQQNLVLGGLPGGESRHRQGYQNCRRDGPP